MRRSLSKILFSFILLLFVVPFGARAEQGEPKPLALDPYKPIYFVWGSPNTKIELSFKTKILAAIDLYFGYTQLLMWELSARTPYFSDLNYNPEIFYRQYLHDEKNSWLDYGFYEHESNGTGGPAERSWNRTSLRYHSRLFGDKEGTKIYTELKVWVPYWFNSHNTHIAEYRGLGEFQFTLSDFLGAGFEVADINLRFYLGGSSELNPLQGGQELTFRLKGKGSFLPLFLIQLFNGYGESLGVFSEHRTAARVGIGF